MFRQRVHTTSSDRTANAIAPSRRALGGDCWIAPRANKSDSGLELVAFRLAFAPNGIAATQFYVRAPADQLSGEGATTSSPKMRLAVASGGSSDAFTRRSWGVARFIRSINASHALKRARAGSAIQALRVALFTYHQRRVYPHL